MNPALLLWIVLLLPFAGFLLLILPGKKINSVAGWLGIGLLAINTGLGIAVQSVAAESHVWFSLGENNAFHLGFRIDVLTMRMFFLVQFVAGLVHLFSIEYMREDPARFRYFAFLQLFVGSMLGIIWSDNLLMLYIFWELVGLSSYLLIGFWYTKQEAIQASKKAFLVNRIGDVGLALGIFGLYTRLGVLDFSALSSLSSDDSLTVIGLLLFCGTIAKSAQFPLHIWLPDAMEGPTPVSALIHAATMVAAGVYLLARIFPILTPDALVVMASIGAITMLLGAVYALTQTDIKKTLAYSTISQLGLMVLAIGVGAPQAAVFHLFTHAFFKAGLFLSAGSVIHSLHHAGHGFDAQDVREMGGLRTQLPITFIAYTVCAAALAGLPLTSGFLSKDEILHEAFMQTAHSWKLIFPILALASAGLTAFYMAKQWRLIFWGRWRNTHVSLDAVHEASWYQKGPLVLLALCSLPFLFSLNPLGEHFAPLVALASTVVAVVGVLAGWRKYQRYEPDPNETSLPTLDGLYDRIFVKPVLQMVYFSNWVDRQWVDKSVNAAAKLQVILAHMVGWFDQFIIDGIPNGLAWLAGAFGKQTRQLQSGKIQSYLLVTVLALAVLLVWWTW